MQHLSNVLDWQSKTTAEIKFRTQDGFIRCLIQLPIAGGPPLTDAQKDEAAMRQARSLVANLGQTLEHASA